jgi:hypothetical protein
LKQVQQFAPQPPYFSYSNGLVVPNDRLRKQNRIGTPGDVTASTPTVQAWRTSPIARWNRAAQSLAQRNPATLFQEARVLAALNAALADALLAGSYWKESYEIGRVNPAFVTIEHHAEFNREIDDGQLPLHAGLFAARGTPLAGFPSLTAVIAGAAEAILAKNFGGGEAMLAWSSSLGRRAAHAADSAAPLITLHTAARECAWAMHAGGGATVEACLSGYDLGIRIGEYLLKQPPR